MKKFTLIVLMLLATFSVKGQVEFAPVGAEWYYERLIMNYETWKYEDVTYDRFRSLDIVEINGWQCKEIELFQNVDCHGYVNPYYETRYINQEGEQIYEVVDGERYLLYDFSKEVGEYWVIEHRPPFELPELPETDTVFVDEIKEIVLADGSKRRMFVTSVNVETCLYLTNIIEGIGLDKSLFPFYELLGPPSCTNTGIRCYSEDDNYLITSDVECDYEEVKPYQSFFGNDSTTINLYTVIIDGDWNSTFTICNNDTITINDNSYNFVEPRYVEYEYGYKTFWYADETIYFREEQENGRLYLYIKNDNLEKEFLLCDMSLNIGDTFTLPSFNDYLHEIVVENVRYEGGKKIIEFGDFWEGELEIDNLMFIEGVFPMVMSGFYDGTFSELICQHKDDELVYIVSTDIEDCILPTYLSIDEVDNYSNNLTIIPTIFSSNETISIESDFEIKEVKMLDMLGREINISINLTDDFTSQISLNQRCNSGIYLIIVETEKDVYYEKVVLRD